MRYLLLVFLSLLSILLAPLQCLADTMRVITKENAIRESCRFFAPVKSVVRYGDLLEVTSTEGDWYKVKFKSASGCIHKGAVEARQASSYQGISGQRGGATSQEVALAGKGFNPQVEEAFKGRHPEMRYSLVDAIERYRVEDKRVFDFIRMGGLSQP